MRKKQKHQTPNTETQVPITKSIITERIFRLSILMFVITRGGYRWLFGHPNGQRRSSPQTH